MSLERSKTMVIGSAVKGDFPSPENKRQKQVSESRNVTSCVNWMTAWPLNKAKHEDVSKWPANCSLVTETEQRNRKGKHSVLPQAFLSAPVPRSSRSPCSLLNLLFEDEDALPLFWRQHRYLFWSQLQYLHDQGSLGRKQMHQPHCSQVGSLKILRGCLLVLLVNRHCLTN